MKIAKTGDTYPIICANDYRDRTYTIDYILSAAKTAGYNSVMLLHTMWTHEREFYVIAYIDVIKDNNDIYLYDRQRSGSSILDAGAYMGSTNPNYSNPMVSASESSDGLQSRGSWTFVSTTYQERTYYEISYDTYEPIFYTDMSYRDIYINNVKVDMNKSGGAGSGYIGNLLLSNKKMVGYNVPTSSAESTKTESVNEASETPVSGKPKIGNGFARIKFLREPSTFSLGNLVKTLDITHKQVTGWDNSGIEDTIITQNLSSYFGTDYILVAQQNNGNYFNTFDGNEGIGHEITMYTGCAIYYPIRPIIATKIKCSSKFDTTGSLSNDSYFELYAGYIENGSMNHITVGSHNKSKEWGIIEKEFDSPVKVEYIEFVVMDNQWHFKDVEITGVLL